MADPAEGSQSNTGSTDGFNPFEGEEAASGEQTTEQQQTPAPEAKPSVVGLTPEQLKELVSGVATATQPKQETRVSAEDFDKTFNVVRVTPELLTQLGIPVTAENAAQVSKAFDSFGQGLVKQAVTMMNYAMQARLQEVEGSFNTKLTPIEQAYKQQAEASLVNEFLEQNKDLKGWEPLLHEIKNSFAAQGKRFETKEQAFKAVADRARELVKVVNAQNNGTQRQTTSGGAQTRRPSTVSAGGQGGSGGSPGGNGKANTAKTLFG